MIHESKFIGKTFSDGFIQVTLMGPTTSENIAERLYSEVEMWKY